MGGSCRRRIAAGNGSQTRHDDCRSRLEMTGAAFLYGQPVRAATAGAGQHNAGRKFATEAIFRQRLHPVPTGTVFHRNQEPTVLPAGSFKFWFARLQFSANGCSAGSRHVQHSSAAFISCLQSAGGRYSLRYRLWVSQCHGLTNRTMTASEFAQRLAVSAPARRVFVSSTTGMFRFAVKQPAPER